MLKKKLGGGPGTTTKEIYLTRSIQNLPSAGKSRICSVT